MEIEKMTNEDLLTMLVGRKNARNLARKPLVEIMGFVRTRPSELNEESGSYVVHPALGAAKELFIRSIRERMETEDLCFTSPESVKAFLCSKIGHLEHEVFWGLWMHTKHGLIVAEELARGTLKEARVYVREIVKRAIAVNAATVIFAHNHPSGNTEPSIPDKQLTDELQKALALVDVRVLDHFIVSGNQATSFADSGLI